jgi:hypothetical protein
VITRQHDHFAQLDFLLMTLGPAAILCSLPMVQAA